VTCRWAGKKCQSRYNEGNDTVVDDPGLDAVASHRLNDRPVFPKESRRLMYVWSVYLDATGSPFTVVRDLKEEGVAGRLPIAIDRGSLLSHSASPLICVEREQLAFSILPFVRRDCDAGNNRLKCCKHPTVGTRTAWQAAHASVQNLCRNESRADHQRAGFAYGQVCASRGRTRQEPLLRGVEKDAYSVLAQSGRLAKGPDPLEWLPTIGGPVASWAARNARGKAWAGR
jgi:hypothetical protein